jgi:hypothetical protein
MIRLACVRYINDNGIIEATKSPKYRFSSSPPVVEEITFTFLECFNETRSDANPSIKQTFTIFEPNTFPTASPTAPVNAEIKDTLNSGIVVEKATKVKPTVVFLTPVISETFTALVIAVWLALSKASKKAIRISKLTINGAPITFHHNGAPKNKINKIINVT